MQTRVASPPSNSTHSVDTLEKAQAAVTASSEDQASASTTEGGDNESVVSEVLLTCPVPLAELFLQSPQLDPAIERLSSCIDTIRGGGRVRTRTRHGKKKLQREELGKLVVISRITAHSIWCSRFGYQTFLQNIGEGAGR